MKRAIVLLVLLSLAAAWYLLQARRRAGAQTWSGVLESREMQVGSRVGGRVAEVLVQDGQLVEAGAVLVRLERREWEAERAQLEARRLQAEAATARFAAGYRPEEVAQAEAVARQWEAALTALRDGPRPQERDQAAAEYAAAQADARNAEATYRRLATLFQSGDLSAQAHDDARSRRDLAAARAEASRQRLELLRAGTRAEDIRSGEQRLQQARANAAMLHNGFRKEDIAEARARLAEIEALLKANAIRLDETEIRSPLRARVETVSVRPGDLAVAGKGIATLLEQDQVWARLYVPEPELGRLRVGDSLALQTDTFPGKRYPAVVEQVNSKAEYLPRNVQTLNDRSHLVFGIRVKPRPSSAELKPGMTVFATLSDLAR
ncbi:MAG: HlyD family efflux transporter periplasmic adaptor subunit [Acidobacteria bacterium]|nr:HlyD family efflux transporter periplasmic adaptor subunit [Acidobacteriota bacterium]